jgi:hypothetical protein
MMLADIHAIPGKHGVSGLIFAAAEIAGEIPRT